MARILIVDDDKTSLRMLQSLLEHRLHKVILASDGEDGLQKAMTEHPQLIILDIIMPRLDGLKVCRTLKNNYRYKNIPIIMLSVLEEEEKIKAARDAGADEYIVKPYQPEDILEKINRLLNANKK